MYLPDKAITVAIVDDHPVVIEGLRKILLDGLALNQLLQYSTGEAFLLFLQQCDRPVDLVLLDVSLPGKSGIEICREIKKMAPQTQVVGFSNHLQRGIVIQMLQNGATGYLHKNVAAEILLENIKNVLDGKIAFSKEVAAMMAQPTKNDLNPTVRLTKREGEVLRMIAEGKTSAEIGSHLYVSPVTVETHRRNLMQKLEVKNVASLIKIAIENGLL